MSFVSPVNLLSSFSLEKDLITERDPDCDRPSVDRFLPSKRFVGILATRRRRETRGDRDLAKLIVLAHHHNTVPLTARDLLSTEVRPTHQRTIIWVVLIPEQIS